jgi:hypothetical protein
MMNRFFRPQLPCQGKRSARQDEERQMHPSHNRIDLKASFTDFRDNRLTFSVSSRSIRPDIDIMDYLRVFYTYCNTRQIESVFGSANQSSRLYGGRLSRSAYELTDVHLARLSENGIHLALTLTNHYFDEDAYRESWSLLEAHHKSGNSIICANDELAVRLKRDFPLYELKASIIKEIDSLDKVNRALDLYHALTLPMDRNDDDDFLHSLPEKHRIILFGNANCAYTCPARTCYLGFSQENYGKPVTFTCSKGQAPRLDRGHVYFNVSKLADMGFTRFKLVPLALKGAINVCRKISRGKGYLVEPIRRNKAVHYLCSYPKCGRTWLRFILAHYLNNLYDLGMEIDLHSFFSLMPTDDHNDRKGIGAYRFPADHRFPLLLASHHYPNGGEFNRHKDSRIVFIFRSIPDVVVSEYFHRSRFMNRFNGDLKEFVRSPEGGVAGYCGYLNAWATIVADDRALAVTYEMLHRDAERTVAELLRFLDVPVDAGPLREAVQASTFEAMQAIENERGMPDHQARPDDPENRRVRNGTVGGSRAYLDREDLEYIHRTCESLLTDSAKALLRRYRLWDR